MIRILRFHAYTCAVVLIGIAIALVVGGMLTVGSWNAHFAIAAETMQTEAADVAAPDGGDQSSSGQSAGDAPAAMSAHDPASSSFAMPDLVGMKYSDARKLLDELGIHGINVCKYVDGHLVPFNPLGVVNPNNWTVQVQSPEAGEQVDSTTDVMLALVRSGVGFDGVDVAMVWAHLFGR